MSEMNKRKRQREERDSWKYKRIVAALEACGFTEKYEEEFLENEMNDDIVQKCIEDPKQLDYYLSSIIPKIGHKVNFVLEFKKTKGNEGEQTSSSSQPAKNTPGRMQQTPANPNLNRVNMEVDDVLVKEKPEGVGNSDDGELEIENSRNPILKHKRKETLEENYMDTVRTLDWIGGILGKDGRFKEALDIYKKVYEIRKRDLGENHPLTINMKSRIVNVERKSREENVFL